MWKFIKRLIYLYLVLNILGLAWGRFFNPPITITQIQGWVTYGKLQRNYIAYSQMGDNVKKAVIASEDQRFFTHHGFDFKAIQRAIKHNNQEENKTRQGGSTISQQTAKNIFLWNGGGYFRKAIEAVYTVAIELLWNKDIILERYLNTIEMGQGVFGVEAAAHYYFKKSSKDLTRSEAAWIAATLPNPQVYDPKNPSRYLKRKHAWILRQMRTVELE